MLKASYVCWGTNVKPELIATGEQTANCSYWSRSFCATDYIEQSLKEDLLGMRRTARLTNGRAARTGTPVQVPRMIYNACGNHLISRVVW